MGKKQRNILVLSEFPNTSLEPFEITSPETEEYNCIAWAVEVMDTWFEPDDSTVWFQNIPADYLLSSVIAFFQKQGFEICANDAYAENYTKIGLFSKDNVEFSHVARQLNQTKWTSKLGFSFDVKHTLFAMENGIYGVAVIFMKK